MSKSFRRRLLIAALGTALGLFAAVPAHAGCLDHFGAAEKAYGIPTGLLMAVSLVESGQGGVPAAYAVNVKGKAMYARNEADAARFLRDSRGALRSGATVGCMQLSLTHHKSAFRPVDKILDPEENVHYAARYLGRLRQETGSWAAAVARYNGSSGRTAKHYQCKVQRALSALGAESVALIDGTGCGTANGPVIAPRTRKAFERMVAAATS